MIHFFDGFNWPAISTGVLDTNSFSEFWFGGDGVLLKVAGAGRLEYTINTAGRCSRPAKRTVPLGKKLVIGYNATHGAGGTSHSLGYSTWSFTPVHGPGSSQAPSFDGNYSTALPVVANSLPVLQIGVGTTQYPGLSLRNSVNGGSIWYEALPGVNFKTLHYYEVVYDVENNKIEVWLDNLLVGTLAYKFTDVQKNSEFRIRLDVVGYYGSGSLYAMPSCSGVYVATERLGPVKFGYRPPAADADVSPSFKSAPYFSKVNQRSDGTVGPSTRITTTESKQRALFSNPTVVQGDVLALTIGGRFSSLEQSALEALGAAKLTLKSNGQFHQTEAISIPKQSFVKTTEYLEKSPFTGSTWTADEVNNMLFGVEIVVDPKNVS